MLAFTSKALVFGILIPTGMATPGCCRMSIAPATAAKGPSTPRTKVAPPATLPNHLDHLQEPPSSPSGLPLPASREPIREVSSDEAWAAYQGKAVFLDARRSGAFESSHVLGAWNLPIREEDVLLERMIQFEASTRLQPSAAMVIYCSGSDCEDSHLLALKMVQMGYRHILIYKEGYPDWASKGRPTS